MGATKTPVNSQTDRVLAPGGDKIRSVCDFNDRRYLTFLAILAILAIAATLAFLSCTLYLE